MKTVVVYYSLNGNTRAIARVIAKQLNCDACEITTRRAYPRAPWLQMVVCGAGAMFGRTPRIDGLSVDIREYDNIILGTPVWAGSYAAPVRTFLKTHDLRGKNVALFVCHAASKLPDKSVARFKQALDASRVIGQSDYQDPLRNNPEEQAQKAKAWACRVISPKTES